MLATIRIYSGRRSHYIIDGTNIYIQTFHCQDLSFTQPSLLHHYSLLPFFPFFLPTLSQYLSSSLPLPAYFLEVLNEKATVPSPPPPPVKPAGTSVTLLLSMCRCGTAESFPREGVAWRSACIQVGNGCTGALGPLTSFATRCKARKRRQAPQNAAIFATGRI